MGCAEVGQLEDQEEAIMKLRMLNWKDTGDHIASALAILSLVLALLVTSCEGSPAAEPEAPPITITQERS